MTEEIFRRDTFFPGKGLGTWETTQVLELKQTGVNPGSAVCHLTWDKTTSTL